MGEVFQEVANFGITLSLTPERTSYIDFGIGYYFDPVTLVTSKNRQDSAQWKKIITPFQGLSFYSFTVFKGQK